MWASVPDIHSNLVLDRPKESLAKYVSDTYGIICRSQIEKDTGRTPCLIGRELAHP